MVPDALTSNFSSTNLIYNKMNQDRAAGFALDKKQTSEKINHQTVSKNIPQKQADKFIKDKRKVQQISPLKQLTYSSVALTETLYGTFGFGLGLMYLRQFVNSKLLIGNIYKHYTDKIKDNELIANLALKMRKENGLENKVPIYTGSAGEAYFSSGGGHQKIVVGKDSFSALFHELGHAIIENKTKILKSFQTNRNLDAYGAITLYMLFEGAKYTYPENNASKNKKTNNITNKTIDFFVKYSEILPLLIYSPELVSELGATGYGLKFLKKELKNGSIDKNLFKNVKNSYAAAFGTYLFIPLSLMLMSSVNRTTYNKKLTHKQRLNNTGLSIGLGAAGAATAGGIAYANSTFWKNKSGYREDVIDKILTSKINPDYAQKTSQILNNLKIFSAFKNYFANEDSTLSDQRLKDLKFDEAYERYKKFFEAELDKIYDRKKRRFLNPEKLESGYKELRSDIKKIVDDKTLKSVKTAAVPAGFCAAYLSFILGRLIMKYPSDKTKRHLIFEVSFFELSIMKLCFASDFHSVCNDFVKAVSFQRSTAD